MAFRFRKFQVFQDAKVFHLEVVNTVSTFSPKYFYLSDQMRRSSLSVLLNIAEGSSKQSDRDFNRFITISLGSVDETIAGLEVALSLKLIPEEKFIKLESDGEKLCRQLGGLSKKLRIKS